MNLSWQSRLVIPTVKDVFLVSWWWKGEGYYQKSFIVTQVVHVPKPSSCRLVIIPHWVTWHQELFGGDTDIELGSSRVTSWCLKYHKTFSRLIILGLLTHFLRHTRIFQITHSYTHKFSHGSEIIKKSTSVVHYHIISRKKLSKLMSTS